VTIIPDSAVAQILAEGLVNKVITGADQLARNGDIANKIGTYQIALLARNFKIPFYVLAPPPSNAKTGKDIAIEIRPDNELLTIAGQRIAPKEVKGYYPAFDITPVALITRHIYLRIS
jgi:methylthioribose-1-phosphate isomerase